MKKILAMLLVLLLCTSMLSMVAFGASPASDEEENATGVEKRTLIVEVPDNWTTVYVYSWDDYDDQFLPFGEYPGLAMSNRNQNTYELEVGINVHYLVFSNQDGKKTNDLNVYGCDPVQIKIGSDCKAVIVRDGDGRKPSAITPNGELSEYRVVGNADWLGNWDAAFEGGRMYDMGNGLYRKVFEDVPIGAYEIKITKDGKWDNAYGDNGKNFTFTVAHKCNVTVDLKLTDATGVISVYGSAGWWDDEEEENPAAADLPVGLPAAFLLSGAVALMLLLRMKKQMK